LFDKNKPLSEKEIIEIANRFHEYKTDTLRIVSDKPYIVKVPNGFVSINPRDYIQYIDTSKTDTVIIHDSVEMHFNFNKYYPDKPKILSMTLQLDSTSITTYDKLGTINIKKYPLYLVGRDYYFDGNEMTSKVLSSPRTLVAIKNPIKWYANAGYDLGSKTPYFSTQVMKDFNRFKIEIEPYYSNRFGLVGKIGYNICR